MAQGPNPAQSHLFLEIKFHGHSATRVCSRVVCGADFCTRIYWGRVAGWRLCGLKYLHLALCRKFAQPLECRKKRHQGIPEWKGS